MPRYIVTREVDVPESILGAAGTLKSSCYVTARSKAKAVEAARVGYCGPLDAIETRYYAATVDA